MASKETFSQSAIPPRPPIKTGAGPSMPNVDIRPLAGRAGGARSEQENAIGRIGHMPPDHRSGEFGGVRWVPDSMPAVVSLPPRFEQGDRRRVRNPRARHRDG